jgi:hypothetical protein
LEASIDEKVASFLFPHLAKFVWQRIKHNEIVACLDKLVSRAIPELQKTPYLEKMEFNKKVHEALQSRKISKDVFLQTVMGLGIERQLALSLFLKVNVVFLSLLREEGVKSDEVFRLIVLRHAEEADLPLSDIKEALESIYDEQLENMRRMVLEIRNWTLQCKSTYLLVNEHLFKQELEDSTIYLSKVPSIQRSIDEEEWALILELSRKFESFWSYVDKIDDLTPAIETKLRIIRQKVAKVFEEVQNPEIECLFALVALLDHSGRDIETMARDLEQLELPAAKSLFLAAVPYLFLSALYLGDKEGARRWISSLRRRADANENEVIYLELLILGSESRPITFFNKAQALGNKLQDLAKELKEHKTSKERAFVAGELAKFMDEFGFPGETEQLIHQLKIGSYFPDTVKIHELTKSQMQGNYSKSIAILEDIALNSPYLRTRKWAEFCLLSIRELPRNPWEAFDKALSIYKAREIDEVDYSKFILNYYVFYAYRGVYKDNLLEHTTKLLRVRKPESVERAEILLELASSAYRKGNIALMQLRLQEAGALPMNFSVYCLYLMLKARLLRKSNELDSAEKLIEPFLRVPDVRSRLDMLSEYISICVAKGNLNPAIELLKDLLRDNSLLENSRFKTYCLLVEALVQKEDFEGISIYEEDAIEIFKKLDWNSFISNWGIQTLKEFIVQYTRSKLTMSEKASLFRNYSKACNELKNMPSMLMTANKLNDEKTAELALDGCKKRIENLQKLSRKNSIEEIDAYLKLNLTKKQKNAFITLKAKIYSK